MIIIKMLILFALYRIRIKYEGMLNKFIEFFIVCCYEKSVCVRTNKGGNVFGKVKS